jgi:SAM-dependent methyltransferase
VENARVSRFRRTGAHAIAVAGDLGYRGAQRLSRRLAAHDGPSLSGDRWVEWSFCMSRLVDGPGRTLDFGADIAFLSLAAAQRGHDVVALDRLPSSAEFDHPRVRFLEADILTHDFGAQRFDQIINCSSVEHVGLGGRYGSSEASDGDLDAMAALRSVLEPGGSMILTIPIGRDRVCAPLHRIYGHERLPRLLDGLKVDEEQYWRKRDARWEQTDRADALDVEGSESFYALGLFRLRRSPHG